MLTPLFSIVVCRNWLLQQACHIQLLVVGMMMMSVCLSLPKRVYFHPRKGFCHPYLLLARTKTVNAVDFDDSLMF
jgi:hypothetical protein